MIEFLEISDEDPALFHSPMVRAIEKTFAYIAAEIPAQCPYSTGIPPMNGHLGRHGGTVATKPGV